MVNTGRPSRSCKACRARRLKCDQTKPACIKCIKAGQPCPGYSKAFEVNFKDQTEAVIRRHARSTSTPPAEVVQVQQKGHQRTTSLSDLSDIWRDASTSPSESGEYKDVARKVVKNHPKFPHFTLPSYVISLETSVPHQATCYFMSTFVNLSPGSKSGNLQFMSSLIKTGSQNPTLHSAFLAVSMAALATRPNPGNLVPMARAYYHNALENVSRTLKEKEKSKEDESLAAIIMLIFYETLMWEDSKGSLIYHIRGAQAIVNLRGSGQKKSPVGKAMFEIIRNFMVHQYAQSPHYDVEEMTWWLNEGADSNQPPHVMQGLTVETTVLRRQLADFLKSEPDSSRFLTAFWIHSKAKKLEVQVRRWYNTAADAKLQTVDYWQCEVPEDTIRLAQAHPGKVYTYDNIFIAAKFLNVHLQWLALAEIMATIASWVQNNCATGHATSTQKSEAVAMAEEQIAEIISIAPYYCQWPTYDSPSPLGGMTCSLPLYVTGFSPFTTKKQRAFLIGRLRHLSEAASLKLSGKFADNMEYHLNSPPELFTKMRNVRWQG